MTIHNAAVQALFRAGPVLLATVLGAACAAAPPPSSAPGAAAAPAAEACFRVESLAAEERALADSLVAAGLDNEALYTFAGRIKPMSSIESLRLRVARADTTAAGRREAVEPAASDLVRMERYQRVADALECGPIRMVVVPYRAAQDSVRTVQISVVHRELFDHLLERDRTFWGQWGFVPGTDPAVVVTVVEFERSYDRFRGYGYLFGYPEHAVTFFVDAAREGDARGALVPRDFFHIPVHARPDARFVYAVPPGHVPTAADQAIRAEAARVLEEYRARRPRFENPDGTLRAVELLRDWYAERGGAR